MRRILRKIAAGEEDSIGDTSTLADPSVSPHSHSHPSYRLHLLEFILLLCHILSIPFHSSHHLLDS